MAALERETRCSCGYTLREVSARSTVKRCVHCDVECTVKKTTGKECPRCEQLRKSVRS